ncbi:hypothetical protein MG293_002611 [Ovis ammon polii]|uniref:Oxidized low-density lipoprotein receptor 1 n=3 Tax=Ovis TaxID=9935 RepID=A0AAD4YGQ3_OVIAM|nr:hypothetical protein MG293_002611 [Ovis ammon polii]
MTVDDHKSMRDQLDQKPNGETAKGTRGLRFVSSWKWYPAAVTLGVLCLGLLVTVILLILQLSQVSDLLKQQQANITHQENILEGQILAQRQSEKSSQESQKELKEMIETLAHRLDEKSKKLMELHRQNLNLQEVLKEAANYSGPCPQDWLWHEENCYQFSSGSFNWEKSQENCLSLDAHLLKINSTDELAVVLGERRKLSDAVSIQELSRTMEYQSSVENLDEDGYTQLDFSSRSITRRSVVSEKGVFSSACPPNWITCEDSCYLFNTLLDSWDGSKRRCFQLGSNLLKIDSSKELEFISRRVSSQPDHSFWIGLSRRQTEEPWLWEDGSTLLSNLFQIRSTVTEKDSSHNCAWIHVSDIYNQLCSVHSYSICEKKLSI